MVYPIPTPIIIPSNEAHNTNINASYMNNKIILDLLNPVDLRIPISLV